MTDRIQGFTVTLSKDIRDDDFESIFKAVLMIKGVAFVTPSIVTSDDHYARDVLRRDLRDKLLKAVHQVFDND